MLGVIPNDNQRKQNLLNGEINVVKLADSANNGIGQKPELESKIKKQWPLRAGPILALLLVMDVSHNIHFHSKINTNT